LPRTRGIFEKNGLDVQLVFFTGGTTAVMALVSADTPIAQLAGAAVINSVMAGSDAALIVGGVTFLNYYSTRVSSESWTRVVISTGCTRSGDELVYVIGSPLVLRISR
jgi:ABC-type nitrate/sulfonate/bicarbonate transport system substrate-binding protein